MPHIHVPMDDPRHLDRRLWLSMGLNLSVTAAEVVGGVLSGSLGLLADAVHNLSDVATLGLAIVARRLGRRPASYRDTYGLKQTEVLVAILNALVLAVITIFVAREAIARLLHPSPVQANVMLPVAMLALLANLGSVLLLRGHDRHDLNVRSAFLHLMQDALCSLAVVIAALLAHLRIGPYLDPLAALLVGIGIARSAVSIVWQATGTLVEAAPIGFDLETMVRDIERQFRPVRMHHVHVWEVGPGQTALTAHLSVPDMGVMQAETLAREIRAVLAERWRVEHATLEPEVNGCGSVATLGQWKTTLH